MVVPCVRPHSQYQACDKQENAGYDEGGGEVGDRGLLLPGQQGGKDWLYQGLHTNTILDKNCWAIPIPNTNTIPNLNPQSKLSWWDTFA